ncbi:hypothetical protein CkaCkLH20_08101 [Colletotrichum karsti]|uniref:DUF7872 domain-containing protein n=1 Tax=Colletotrichum karsti TaxID=1095194 RepID=A0A9P6HZN3_9PEZI|nr:uncharacterized protein CkaCkLH20_08101 [Colletotrichum karsti]KAF9874538.1 hypothetical protein CkaCkLH20_08101 [Colletotrichum karsti]
MRPHIFLALSASAALASPLPQGTGKGADSCPTDPLEAGTWTKLNLDKFLSDWVAKNVTETKTNNIQSLADSFGAPNFFCGMSSFCNAGQPCLPIQPPGWYAMVAIQNWNSYMNALNEAVDFASGIISNTLPGMVTDFIPDPVDNVTPLIQIGRMFTTVLGAIPLTGPLDTAKSAVTGGLGFLLTQIKPPAPTDKFLTWSNTATSLAAVVKEYQAAIATSMQTVLDAPVMDKTSGIGGILSGGQFLGVHQNVTQGDLQKGVTDTMTRFGLGLALQASRYYVMRFIGAQPCIESDAAKCVADDKGTNTAYVLQRYGTWGAQDDTAKKLADKYGLKKEDFLDSVLKCFDDNGKKLYADPFKDAIPLDPATTCVFNIGVCEIDPVKVAGKRDYDEECNAQLSW